MAEQVWALVDTHGVVRQTIVADQAFIDALPELVADPDVDSGDLVAHGAYDVTDVTPRPGLGWCRRRGGTWTPPTTLEPAEATVGPDAPVRLTFTDHRPEPEPRQWIYVAGEPLEEREVAAAGTLKFTVLAEDLPARPDDLPAGADWPVLITVGGAQATVVLTG